MCDIIRKQSDSDEDKVLENILSAKYLIILPENPPLRTHTDNELPEIRYLSLQYCTNHAHT